MKIIITGTGGSVGPHVVNKFSNEGWTVYPWNRNIVNPENPKAVEEFVNGIQPDAIIHLATGSHNWTEQLSALSKKYGARFLYTSSVSTIRTKTVRNFPYTEPAENFSRTLKRVRIYTTA